MNVTQEKIETLFAGQQNSSFIYIPQLSFI